MAVVGGQPNQFGGNTLNMWAMLKALINNRLGIVPFSGVPVDGTSGTYAKFAGPGFMLVDIATGIIYVNKGLTAGSPVWTPMNAPVSGLGGLGNLGVAKMTYDTAVDGLAQGTITPANSPIIPAKAIILGGAIDITTTLTSGGSATIAVGTSAGSSTTSIKGATAVASWTAGMLAMVPLFTAASYVKMTAAGRPTVTIATADLLTGKFDVNLLYAMGN